MRDNRMFSPKERLKQMLHDKQLLQEIDMNKVECIIGDVITTGLEINKELYIEMAENIDAVFNLSVKAGYSDYYCKSENKSNPQVVNVIGAKNILQFACDKKTKHVFHASSTLCNTKSDDNGISSEDWPVEGEFDDQPNSSYTVSKYICDRLMAEAVKRGIPCKVFRFPIMGGDSKLGGGNVSVLDNQLMMRMLLYMQVGMMPSLNIPMVIAPVDICAHLSIQIFFNDETPYEMYNVSNPFVEDEILLEDYAKEFGHYVEVVETDLFFQGIQNLKGENADQFKSLVKLSRPAVVKQYEENLPEIIFAWLAGEKNIFLSRKLCKWLPDEYPHRMETAWTILKRNLKYAKNTGVFDKISLRK